MNDENYMVGDIATHGGGSFSFDLVSSKGVASGPATIKILSQKVPLISINILENWGYGDR